MMKEQLETQDIYNLIHSEGIFILYGYAPICANCRIAERMLKLTQEIHDFEYTAIDLNYHVDIINDYKITSAPALLIFEDGELKESVYRFKSVTNLLNILERHR